ncbi:MAG TPA: CoA ester lyase [Chloroflexota bacterium]|nr:CoA ester lyase [Chloroflexota bacterium]
MYLLAQSGAKEKRARRRPEEERKLELLRSFMFVPGNSEKMTSKALGLRNLDVAMFDLEDGVPHARKAEGRALLPSVLGQPPGGPRRWVRINAIGTENMQADLEAVVREGLEGLVLPKVETAEDVRVVERYLDEHEVGAGLARGSVGIVAAIESARGLLNAPAIAAACPRMVGLMFGAEDFGLDLGLPTNREGEARELLYARSAVVVAAASAHVQAIDGVWPDFHDEQGLRADAIQARRLGFSGKSTFHPGQIDVINEVFTPTEADAAYARRVVDAFEEAEATGAGAVALGGQLVDRPIVERARRVLELYAATRRS